MEERISEIALEAEKSKGVIAEHRKALSDCVDWYEELLEYVSREKELKDAKEEEIYSINAETDAVSENIFNCNAKIAGLEDRYRFYSSVKDGFEGYKFSVKKLMSDSKNQPELSRRVKGVIADIVKCDEKYETAVETAFGGAMQNIVTATSDDARYLIEYLKRTKGGSVTFLPVASLKPRYETDFTRRALKERGALGLATELVRYDKYYDNIIYNLLGNTLIVDNIANANEISKKFPHAFRMVTLDGDIISTSGSMTGGSRRADSGNLLANERNIEKALADIEEVRKEVSALSKKKTLLEEKKAKTAGKWKRCARVFRRRAPRSPRFPKRRARWKRRLPRANRR